MLVLATTHLANVTKSLGSAHLATLIGKLETYNPDVIATESLSPELVAMMVAEGDSLREVVQQFAAKRLELAPRAQKPLDLERLAAKAEAKRLSVKRDAEPLSPIEHARLILSLIATYDLSNAALTWAGLPTGARKNAGDMDGLAEELKGYLESPDERVSVVLRLAARLGHSRVYYFDDHRDAALFELYGERINDLDEALFRHHLSQVPEHGEAGRLIKDGLRQNDLWDLYRYINAPAFLRALVNIEVGIYYRLKLPSGIHRMRAAQRETRNLYMAGNLRLASALHPGGCVLAVVGWSRKPFLDRYLAQLTDVELVHLGNP